MSRHYSSVTGFRLWALGLLAVLPMLYGGGAWAQSNPQAPFLNLIQYLHNTDGDTVSQGVAVPFGGCPAYVSAFGSCFGNNKSTPYYVLDVPLGGISLPSYLSGFHPTGNASVNTFYELHANEALITIITLPPLAAYFSQESYMVERDPRWYDASNYPAGYGTGGGCTPGAPFTTGTAPNTITHSETADCGYDVFGFLNNAINNALVNRQAGFSFSGTPSCTSQCAISVVTTPNAGLYAHIVSVFGATLGYNTSLLFEEGMATSADAASSLLYIDPATQYSPPQSTYNPDIFATVLRYTIPQDGGGAGTASLAWQNAIGSNILTFRVTDPSRGVSAIATPTITTRACNTDESGYSGTPSKCPAGATVGADLATLTSLIEGWMQANVSTSYTMATAGSPPAAQGFGCLISGKPCAGASPDTDSYRSYPPPNGVVNLVAGLPIIGVGVLHSASPSDTTTATPANNAVYTGLSLADDKLNAGNTGENIGLADQTQTNLLATGFAQGKLEGSAAKILSDMGIASPSQQFTDDLPNLYVVVFNQTSSAPCVIPGSGLPGTPCSQSYTVNIAIPSADPVKITERGYLYPPASAMSPSSMAMQIGSDPNYLLSPNILFVPAAP